MIAMSWKVFISAVTIAGLLIAVCAMQASLVSAASVNVSLGSPQQNSRYTGVVPLIVSATYSGSGEVAFYSFYYYLDGNPGGDIGKTSSIFKTQLNLTPGEHQLRITANAFTKDQVAYTERTGSIPFIGIATGIAEVSFFVEPTYTPSPNPSPTPISSDYDSKVNVSGSITPGVGKVSTEIIFAQLSAYGSTVQTFTAPVISGHYSIILPNNQYYAVSDSWTSPDGSSGTHNFMLPYHVSAGVGITSITCPFSWGEAPTSTPTANPSASETPTTSASPTIEPTLEPSPSPTLEPTLEPAQTATPTNDNNQTLDLTPTLALAGLAVIAIVVLALFYFKRRRN